MCLCQRLLTDGTRIIVLFEPRFNALGMEHVLTWELVHVFIEFPVGETDGTSIIEITGTNHHIALHVRFEIRLRCRLPVRYTLVQHEQHLVVILIKVPIDKVQCMEWMMMMMRLTVMVMVMVMEMVNVMMMMMEWMTNGTSCSTTTCT